jgi:hypothetical protein
MKLPWSKAAREEKFWQWFVAHEARLRDVTLDNETAINALHEALHKVQPGLTFEIGRDPEVLRREFETLAEAEAAGVSEDAAVSAMEAARNPGETFDFCISADGKRDLFPAVVRLVEAAPAIPGWRVLAFRQRGSAENSITMDDVELRSEQMWFRLERDDDKVGLHLYFEGVAEPHGDQAAMMAFILLDHALGEYDVETRLGFFERHDLNEAGDSRAELRPFRELPAAFDAFYDLHVAPRNGG